MNRYFVIELANHDNEVFHHAVCSSETMRKSLDGTKGIVKLAVGDENNYDCLNGVTEYTHSEMLQYLEDNSIDWNQPLI